MLSFLTPVALALAALAIPIIMLYMLRLRRTEMPISSTFLWQQLVRDREANAPWQRLRFNWLLLLQLLVLAALVLALARPFATVKTITTGRIVLLLDASASMRATDVAPNRFAEARAVGLDLVDTLGTDDTMTVIRVAEVPEVLAAASRDKLVLRNAIRDAQPSAASADWSAAMTLAAAGAVGVDELKVVIVTDGGLPEDVPPVPGDVRFVQVGESAQNVALSALATSALPGQPPQLFVQISNYGDREAEVIMDLRLDDSGVLYTARRYTVPARGHVDVFDINLPDSFTTLTAQLTSPSNASVVDHLSVDDRAYAVRERVGAGRVLLVTEDNVFLQQIFRSLRGVQLFQAEPGSDVTGGEYDLYVLDGVLPDELPDGDLLIVNPPRDTGFFTLGDTVGPAGSLRVHADDPRVRNLNTFIDPVHVRAYRTVSEVDWGTVLVAAGDDALVVAGEVDDRQIVLLPFDVRYPNSDIVLQPAWPLLISELTAWFSPPRVTDVSASLKPGAPVTVRLIEGADRALITRPDGQRRTLEPETSEIVFADTMQSGIYTVALQRGDDTVKTEQFAVNLFDPLESSIAPETSVRLGTTTITQDSREESGRREFWPWVAAAGLAILLVEWWLYHRSLRRIPGLSLAGLRSERGNAGGRGWRARFRSFRRLVRRGRRAARRTR